MIELENVTKMYGPTVGVRDLTFQVDDGEIVGLLGPNGAGKTTTMRMITTFMAPTAGSIRVGGHNVIANPIEVRRHIGYLPENAPAYPELSVREYLRFMAEIKELVGRDITAEVNRVIDRLGLVPVSERLVANVSRGFRQRVGLAQALLGNPELLVLDEPTVGLDPRQIIEIRELIRDLAGERTVLLSSHILSEVQQVCERVIVISGGELVVQDRVDVLGERLAGGAHLYLTARGPVSGLETVLNGLPGVIKVTGVEGLTEAPEEELPRRYTLQLEPEHDMREQLFFALAQRGWPILELRMQDYSLEEIYLELTNEKQHDESSNVGVETNA